LGAENGDGRFLISGVNSSWGMLATYQPRPQQWRREIAVRVKQLDTLISDCEIPAPDVVKMDIEGGEVAALAGALIMLKTFSPVLVIELHDTATPITKLLTRHGYKTCLFGSHAPVGLARGCAHIVAVNSGREDCEELLERFRDSGFPRCE